MLTHKIILLLLLTTCFGFAQKKTEYIDRQGFIAFFSYTSVENIKAENNQVLSSFDIATKEIVASMLMRTFVFEKALMEEHFNESYIESDLYPKATFVGKIDDFRTNFETTSYTTFIKGVFNLHGVSKEVQFKTTIFKTNTGYKFEGSLELFVDDFNIKIPSLLAPNIADTITINFHFEYEPNRK